MSIYGPITLSSTVTSYLPLTTAWPFQAGCSSDFIDNTGSTTGAQLFLNDPKYASVVKSSSSCLPPEVSSWWYQATATMTESTAVVSGFATTTASGGYSMNCPAAYTTVFSLATDSLTTTIGCCPSPYSFSSASGGLKGPADPGQCYSILPAGVVTFVQNNTGVYTTTSSVVPSPSTILAVQVNGYIFSNPAVSTTSTTGSTTSTRSTPPSTSTTSSKTTSTPSSGLSGGAKAGIGVGVALTVLGILAFLAAVVFLWRRRRQSYAPPPDKHPSGLSPYFEAVATEDNQRVPQRPIYEMGTPVRQQYELDTPNRNPHFIELS